MRVHHRKGRNVLYVDQGYTVKINGINEEESDTLLEYLYEHALRLELHYYHKWDLISLVGDDNPVSKHCAVNDYTEPRQMFRMIFGCTEKLQNNISIKGY